MKKTYESPSVEKIAFQYRDQVVVASGTICTQKWTGYGEIGENNCSFEVEVHDSGF